jgi:Zn-dependent protease
MVLIIVYTTVASAGESLDAGAVYWISPDIMTSTIACPGCNTRNHLPGARGRTTTFFCGTCQEELPPQISVTALLVEGARFSRNAVLLFGIPLISGLAFLYHPSFQALSGFTFCLSLTVASVACHEFLHALAAFLLGDRTVYSRGYLRLNPIKYFMGFHTLALPTLIFVFSGIFLPGAAVFIRFDHIPHPVARSLVYLTGVVANALFLVAILALLRSGAVAPGSDFSAVLQFAAFCQICIIVFNLLPVPGLDGWGVISPIFASGVQKLLNALSPLIVVGFAFALISSDAVNSSYASSITQIARASGLELEEILEGKSYAMLGNSEGCTICDDLRRFSGYMRELLTDAASLTEHDLSSQPVEQAAALR